jgi:voltage-gated sodium channel
LRAQVESSKRPPSANACVEGYLELGDKCARMVAMPVFQNMITCCILVAAVLIGCQTYDSLVDKIGPELDQLDALILFVFTLELVLKMIACGTKPWTFFFDPWNTFDFVVVFFCLMPLPGDSGDSVAVLRLLRLLRVLKLFKAVPQLQIIMSGLAQGMVSIGYIALLLTLLMYVFGIIAIMFYRANDPIHFGSLAGTFVTLFRASTFEDWTDIMFIAMYGCKQWSYGEFDFRCENNEEGGLLAAVFFILFILLSALIMLNLVIGSICSSMSDATESYELEKHRDEDVQRIVRKTVMRGYEYNLPGISKEVIYAWIEAFEKMDSATSALSLEASIHKDDIDVVLELIGEHDTLRPRSIEQLLIRANHTVPIGLVDMIAFVEALANDLMSNRIKQLAEKTGWVVIGSCDGLLSAGLDDGEHTLDPYCVVILNGEEVGRTHSLSHSGGHPEWNERIGVPIELLRTTKNTFLIEVLNDHHGADSLLGTVRTATQDRQDRTDRAGRIGD